MLSNILRTALPLRVQCEQASSAGGSVHWQFAQACAVALPSSCCAKLESTHKMNVNARIVAEKVEKPCVARQQGTV